ncbi:hypothetical protein KFK09_016603 [Dendrobium nobile]|uniref:Uncharacterized protein n=1 Tax=Dendrobium nobile TaxID=94219 RepID=A0A8T3B0F7_DENNO|nr:hypothetical protein KFK09_016603 [Dendrobium nobile]
MYGNSCIRRRQRSESHSQGGRWRLSPSTLLTSLFEVCKKAERKPYLSVFLFVRKKPRRSLPLSRRFRPRKAARSHPGWAINIGRDK